MTVGQAFQPAESLNPFISQVFIRTALMMLLQNCSRCLNPFISQVFIRTEDDVQLTGPGYESQSLHKSGLHSNTKKSDYTEYRVVSQSLHKSGLHSNQVWQLMSPGVWKGLNPFISQVFIRTQCVRPDRRFTAMSQSLHKSGLHSNIWMHKPVSISWVSLNPFISQVFIRTESRNGNDVWGTGLNPFISQVFIRTGFNYALMLNVCARLNPFISQVFIRTLIPGLPEMGKIKSQSLHKSGLHSNAEKYGGGNGLVRVSIPS